MASARNRSRLPARRPSSKTSARSRPQSLARYMAASASHSSDEGVGTATTVAAPAGRSDGPAAAPDSSPKSTPAADRAMPTLAVTTTCWPPATGIGAVTAWRSRRAHHALEAPGHLDEEVVADGVAERVVDHLEAVEVEEQHRHAPRPAPRPGQRLAQPVHEQAAVGQPRQRVVQGAVERPPERG